MTNKEKGLLKIEFLAACDGYITDRRLKGARESHARYMAAVKALQAAGLDPADVSQDRQEKRDAERRRTAAIYERAQAAKYAKYKKPSAAAVEKTRRFWKKIAQENGWYADRVAVDGSFYVHVWYGPAGEVIESVYQVSGVRQDTLQAGREEIC